MAQPITRLERGGFWICRYFEEQDWEISKPCEFTGKSGWNDCFSENDSRMNAECITLRSLRPPRLVSSEKIFNRRGRGGAQRTGQFKSDLSSLFKVALSTDRLDNF